MESHGGRSLETPRGVAPTERRTVSPLPDIGASDARGGSGGDSIFRRFEEGRVPAGAPPSPPRRPDCPVRVHSRPQMALVTVPPPQTCVLQPITSSGPIRTTNLVRNSSRTTSGNHVRRNVSDFSTISSSNGRLENSAVPPPSTPLPNGRSHSLSTSRLQNTNQFSNSLTNSATRSRTGMAGSVGNSSVEAVSLTLPRPETERTANEYVETPLRSGPNPMEPKSEASAHGRTVRSGMAMMNGVGVGVDEGGIQRDSNFAMVTLPATTTTTTTMTAAATAAASATAGLKRNSKHGDRSGGHQRHGEEKVVTAQPSATFKKDRFHPEASHCSRQSDDIICSECKRCRCESCRTPRPLPSKWLFGTCHVSADTIVDYATCLCCAKAFFYHCSNDETASCDSDPCSCSRDMFYSRWGCLGVMSLFLPCLFCYWPCRGLVQICESCHQYYSSHGCRCQKHYQEPSPLNFEKRLLDSPE